MTCARLRLPSRWRFLSAGRWLGRRRRRRLWARRRRRTIRRSRRWRAADLVRAARGEIEIGLRPLWRLRLRSVRRALVSSLALLEPERTRHEIGRGREARAFSYRRSLCSRTNMWRDARSAVTPCHPFRQLNWKRPPFAGLFCLPPVRTYCEQEQNVYTGGNARDRGQKWTWRKLRCRCQVPVLRVTVVASLADLRL